MSIGRKLALITGQGAQLRVDDDLGRIGLDWAGLADMAARLAERLAILRQHARSRRCHRHASCHRQAKVGKLPEKQAASPTGPSPFNPPVRQLAWQVAQPMWARHCVPIVELACHSCGTHQSHFIKKVRNAYRNQEGAEGHADRGHSKHDRHVQGAHPRPVSMNHDPRLTNTDTRGVEA